MSESQNRQPIPSIISSFGQRETAVRQNATGPTIQSSIPTILMKNDVKRSADKYDFENAMFPDESNNKDLTIKSQEKTRINDLDEEILQKLFHKARYFVIKSNNFENVHLAKKMNVWATPPANEKRLDQAFEKNVNVFLIFSVRESGVFQGFARIRQTADHSHPRVSWSLPPTIDPSVFSGIFRIDWVTKLHLPFLMCNDIRNPYNDNKEVKISRDGQELDPKIGEHLCRLFQLDPSVDVDKLLNELKIDDIIEKHNSKKIEKSQTLSKDRIIAKSRENYHREQQKSRKHEVNKSGSPKVEGNLIPQVFFDKLIELTNMPYEEYVAAVSNGRQINTLSKLGVYSHESSSLDEKPKPLQ